MYFVSLVDLRWTHISPGHFVRLEKALVIVEETTSTCAGVYIYTNGTYSTSSIYTEIYSLSRKSDYIDL